MPGLGQHLRDHLLAGGGLEADVDEAGTGDLHRLDPLLRRGAGLQGRDQRLRERARVLLQRTGELHRQRAGEVAVGGLLGVLEGRLDRRTGRDLGQRVAERGEELLFGLNHAGILRGRSARNPHLPRQPGSEKIGDCPLTPP